MATIVLQAAGAAIGTMLGGPIGGLIGRAAGAVAGSFIDQQILGGGGQTVKGPRLSDLRVMSSSEGSPVPRLWGRMRVAGQVIWAADFEEQQQTDTPGGKGGGGGNKIRTYSYFGSFAVALCEGEIDGIGRVWADGKPFDLAEVTSRLYTGTETQEADSLILAREGRGGAPAYRGIAYIVFERLPLADFGNRLPQLSFEVIRSAGGAEAELRAVTIIPGSTEFGYDTAVVTREAEEGVTETENAHAAASRSDFSVSLDQLTGTCRNVEAASLVVAWFGSDLRAGQCAVKPGVDSRTKRTAPEAWQVSGTAREAAHPVSFSNGGPAFGGTPSDASVIRAIRDMRKRGLKVMFHPFLLMDVPEGNGRPDPQGGAEQPPYPWRGRITCAVAPGLPGSPDGTAAAVAEVESFLGRAAPLHFRGSELGVTYRGPADWGYRRMVLHYATLCALAGGVEAFLIGSELRGLTTLRGPGGSFPFVAALARLAAEVKAILPDAMISYGADWTEYAGYRPQDGSGDVFFHLDPLWSSPAVGFVGIDNYMPLSDWRGNRPHTDEMAGYTSIHDLAYLKGNIAGGEGFDWYYRTEAERAAQLRTPITDGAHGKPWVFRCKDLKGWWENAHHDRRAGVELPQPSGWVPRSKPIWFTEAGCAAVDKGANEPNAVLAAKAAESLLPRFSSGARDDLMQNRYVTAFSQYWTEAGGHNPVSPVYGGPMVNGRRIFFWAWDARPFPQFPARGEVWADAVNYARGHWLNGRIGALPLGRLIEAVCARHGIAGVDAQGVEGLVGGFLADRVMSAREALEGLMTVHGIDAVESGGTLRFFMRRQAACVAVPVDELAEAKPGAPLYALTRAQETDLPMAVKLAYLESACDYRMAAVEAKRGGGAGRRDVMIELPAAVTQAEAQKRAEVALQEAWSARERAEFALPPSFLALEPGDVLRLALDGGAAQIRIDEIADGSLRTIRGRSFEPAVLEAADAPNRGESARSATLFGRPSVVVMDLALAGGDAAAHAPWIAATARPWPGTLAVSRRRGAAAFGNGFLLGMRATMGFLESELGSGPLGVLDRGSAFTVRLTAGALSSVSMEEVLKGSNAAAVGSMETGWEIIQFATAELVGERRYRLSLLLRGQGGSAPEMAASRPAGERFVLLDEAVVQPALTLAEAGVEQTWRLGPAEYDLGRAQAEVQPPLSLAQAGLAQEWRFGPAQYDIGRAQTRVSFFGRRLGLRPLSPCHVRAERSGGDVLFRWIRRSRVDDEAWEEGDVPLGEEREAYRLEIMKGQAVIRGVTVAEPAFRYAGAMIAADFGADPRQFSLRVAQVSTVFGPGAALMRTIHV